MSKKKRKLYSWTDLTPEGSEAIAQIIRSHTESVNPIFAEFIDNLKRRQTRMARMKDQLNIHFYGDGVGNGLYSTGEK